MALELTDSEIHALLQEPKQLPRHYERLFGLRMSRRGHTEAQLDLTTDGGNRYRILLRQNKLNPLDFSAILGYYLPRTKKLFRLRRCNGKSHEHTNSIEGETFYDFHIHIATERYQMIGAEEDKYAMRTDRYTN